MPSSRAAIFDLDGTLVDSRRAVVDAVLRGVHETLRAHGSARCIDAARARAALGLPALAYFEAVLPAEDKHLAAEALQRATHWEVEAMRSGEGRLFPGVAAGLRTLREFGWRLGVISNAQAPYFDAALRWLELAPLCEFTLCFERLDEAPSDESSKTRMLRRALVALDADPSRSWMIGDRAEDLHAGHALGCRSAGARFGFGEPGELDAADLQFDDFARLVKRLESDD